ncbi:taurine transporter ATP-binding subunit [Rhizobium rhizosphaerae]|uniref:Taurine transporter ATP-binding subunit n=1 Tax=Xaviernesmea rhizosphaerae TaxID=1672749 RepID=A0A1Q9AHQ7_9HYPH|nr:ABC transporter ATP-binding protein [Xaviernesmea rhizosphaerae]OLP54745.1 taurine transporter ATP-binding subunit [Xaviernesmea rhizosphaerae]
MTSRLTFDAVSLAYPDRDCGSSGTRVLEGIDLSVSSGDFVVVIGRSGSGKTSLLNLAAGFQQPTAGAVLLDGQPISGPGAERAVVFQDDALYPWLNARDNIAFPLALKGVAKDARRKAAEELLARVGLAGSGDRRIWELSGGMRQRVGIARALAAEPRFLLLDEPLGALDALTRSKLQLFLLDIWKTSGAGALLITHSIDEALLLATRIVVLQPAPGRIGAILDSGFAGEILSGADPRKVRQSVLFRSMHDGLTALIHDNAHEELAA